MLFVSHVLRRGSQEVRYPIDMGIKYSVNEEFFKIWSKPSAYIVGFIFADGHLENAPYIRGKYVRFTSTDYSILEQIKNALNSSHKIVTTPPTGRCKEKYLLRIGSHKIYNDLKALGLHPRKSLDMRFPEIPYKFLPDFVRGYFDGDGTITFEKVKGRNSNRLKVIFTSGSKVFLLSLALALEKACAIKLAKIYNSHRSYQLIYRSKEALNVLNFIYGMLSDSKGPYLERKYNKYKQLIVNPVAVKCINIFDRNSKIWTYGTKMAAYPSG